MRRGFSLLEMTIVLCLCAVVLGGAYFALSTGQGASQKGVVLLDELSKQIRLTEQLRRVLRTATAVVQSPRADGATYDITYVSRIDEAGPTLVTERARLELTTTDGGGLVAVFLREHQKPVRYVFLDMLMDIDVGAGNSTLRFTSRRSTTSLQLACANLLPSGIPLDPVRRPGPLPSAPPTAAGRSPQAQPVAPPGVTAQSRPVAPQAGQASPPVGAQPVAPNVTANAQPVGPNVTANAQPVGPNVTANAQPVGPTANSQPLGGPPGPPPLGPAAMPAAGTGGGPPPLAAQPASQPMAQPMAQPAGALPPANPTGGDALPPGNVVTNAQPAGNSVPPPETLVQSDPTGDPGAGPDTARPPSRPGLPPIRQGRPGDSARKPPRPAPPVGWTGLDPRTPAAGRAIEPAAAAVRPPAPKALKPAATAAAASPRPADARLPGDEVQPATAGSVDAPF